MAAPRKRRRGSSLAKNRRSGPGARRATARATRRACERHEIRACAPPDDWEKRAKAALRRPAGSDGAPTLRRRESDWAEDSPWRGTRRRGQARERSRPVGDAGKKEVGSSFAGGAPKRKSPARWSRAFRVGWSNTREVSLPLLPSGPGGVHGPPLPDHKRDERRPVAKAPQKRRARLAGRSLSAKAFLAPQMGLLTGAKPPLPPPGKRLAAPVSQP